MKKNKLIVSTSENAGVWYWETRPKQATIVHEGLGRKILDPGPGAAKSRRGFESKDDAFDNAEAYCKERGWDKEFEIVRE